MDYEFDRVAGGTLYRNSITIGIQKPRWARFLNSLFRKLAFDEADARAWLRSNVEEVGNFEHFLPGLFAAQ